MPDKEVQQVLLFLLRSGLWAELTAEQLAPLSAQQWASLYHYAQQHTIEGIVFDGLQLLPAGLMPPRALVLKWTVRVDQIERHNKQMAACMKSQLDCFQAEGIHPLLLKGYGVASCYDIPEHRISGDVDWYFTQKQDYLKANALIRKMGMDVKSVAGSSTVYGWQGIVVEHHRKMFDIHNPFNFRFLRKLQQSISKDSIRLDLQGTALTLPAPILMMLQVNVHILKHLLAFGIGLRQLCDSARVYYSFQAEVNGQVLKHIYQRLGILKWIHLLHAVLVKYIGLPAASLPFPIPEGVNADWMMEEICRAGNFGFSDTNRDAVSQKISSNVRKYFKYAPMEALSFPVLQFISKFAGK